MNLDHRQPNQAGRPHGISTGAIFHAASFVLMVVLWIVRVVLAFTPNNELYDMGLRDAVAIDFTLATLASFVIAVVSLVFRKTCPSLVLFALTQFLAWGHSVGFVLFLAWAAYRTLQAGGV